mgnify:CR=1 FL=1
MGKLQKKPSTVIGKHVNVNVPYECVPMPGKWVGANEELGIVVEGASMQEVEDAFVKALLTAPPKTKGLPWLTDAQVKEQEAKEEEERLRQELVNDVDPPEGETEGNDEGDENADGNRIPGEGDDELGGAVREKEEEGKEKTKTKNKRHGRSQ